jgi:large subunit ribosomal protein L34
MTIYERLFYKIIYFSFNFNMAKRTLSNKSRYSVLKVSGFRARMATPQGRKTIKNRRKKGRKLLTIAR